MTYSFGVYRGDIVLNIDSISRRNYGREFIIQMPIVFWYAYKQFRNENLFEIVDLIDSISKVEEASTKKLDNIIDNVIRASLSLPKSLEGENGVNADLFHLKISSFQSSNDNYRILIKKDSLDVLRNDKSDVCIPNYSLPTKFAPNYFEIIGEWDELSPFRQTIKHIYRRLREEV